MVKKLPTSTSRKTVRWQKPSAVPVKSQFPNQPSCEFFSLQITSLLGPMMGLSQCGAGGGQLMRLNAQGETRS